MEEMPIVVASTGITKLRTEAPHFFAQHCPSGPGTLNTPRLVHSVQVWLAAHGTSKLGRQKFASRLELFKGLLHHLLHNLPSWLDVRDGTGTLAREKDTTFTILPT